MSPKERSHLVRYLAIHPVDALVVLRAAWQLRRRHWWRLTPFLPVPDAQYWAFRMKTAFGDEVPSLAPRELVAVARWSVSQRVGK